MTQEEAYDSQESKEKNISDDQKIEDKDCTKPGNKLPPGPQKWVPGL